MQERQYFVTLFDRNYASRGLALYRSLDRHLANFQLWVVALDSYTEELFGLLDFENVMLVPLRQLETEALLHAKLERNFAEYCWTLTPFLFDVVFAREDSASVVTYIDADMWMAQTTDTVMREFYRSSSDVLITEHAYHPAFDATATSGYFCVQLVAAKRQSSADIIQRWKEQCLEWCFAYSENGKFGDQGYLNDWPSRYGNRVFLPRKRESFQGPWNAMRFPYGEALTYHFHSFINLGEGAFSVGLYPVPKPHRKNLYQGYVDDLQWAEKKISSSGVEIFGRGGLLERINAWSHRLFRFREIWTTH